MSKQENHLAYVDGLRGVAVLMVMCRHYYMAIFRPDLPRWADGFGLGYLGVHLFLLLSGFCIAWAYVGPKARPFAATEFALRRITRIVPPYYLTLAISLVIWFAAGPRSPAQVSLQVLTHLTMTHNLFESTVLALNGPFWSLALESQLYVCFPFLLFGFGRWGALRVLSVVLLAQSAFRVFAMRYGTDYTDSTFVLPWSVAGRVFEFALGMWAAQLVSHGIGTRLSLAQRVGLSLAALCLGVLALSAKRRLGVTHPLTDLLWTGVFFCALVGGSALGSLARRALSFPPVVGLGVMCYSTYLIHALVIDSVAASLMKLSGGRSPLLLMPLALALTLLPCFLFYLGVERPLMEYFKQRRRVATAVAAD